MDRDPTPKKRISVVDEAKGTVMENIGVYVWKFPDNTYLSDGDGRYLSIGANRYDIARINELRNEVRSYGIDEGEPFFLADVAKITDEFHESEMQRMKDGLMPLGDRGAYRDEVRKLNREQRRRK